MIEICTPESFSQLFKSGARDLGVNSIAFPAISTGIYGFPPDRAAKIAIREVRSHAQNLEVVFACFDSETYGLYNRLLDMDPR